MKDLANTYGIVALVFGVIGSLLLLLFGALFAIGLFLIPIPIIAIIFGRLEIKREGPSIMVKTGRNLGIITLIVYLIFGIYGLVYLIPYSSQSW